MEPTAENLIKFIDTLPMDELEKLAVQMEPRIREAVYPESEGWVEDNTTKSFVHHMAVMLLQDLQGRP